MTAPNPEQSPERGATKLRTADGTRLAVGTIPDLELLRRSGSTIGGIPTSMFDAAGAAAAAVASHEAAVDPHPQYLRQAEADLLYDPIGGAVNISDQLKLDLLWGKRFFSDNGFLPSTPINEAATSWPTPDATIFTAASSFSTSQKAAGKFTLQTTGPNVIGYNFASPKSKVLIVVCGVQPERVGTNPIFGPFVQTAALSGADIDNAYLFADNNACQIYKESAGFTLLAQDTSLGIGGDEIRDGGDGMALYYDDATNTLKAFVRKGWSEWMEVLSLTDSTFTTMLAYGFRVNQTIAATKQFRFVCPFVVYAQ